MNIVAYIRVSTDRQAELGLGLDVQRAAIRSWSRSQGHRIVQWTADEGVSGSDGLDAREGLAEALGALRTHRAQGLVVYRIDRLARDLVLQEQLLAEGWRLRGRVFSTSPSEDRFLDPEGAADDPSRALIRQVLGAIAQYERAMIRLRLRSGKARKQANGGYVGGQVALGWRADNGVLVRDQAEQDALRRILRLRDEGRSLREICAALTVEGIPTKRGGAWHPHTLKVVLDRANTHRG